MVAVVVARSLQDIDRVGQAVASLLCWVEVEKQQQLQKRSNHLFPIFQVNLQFKSMYTLHSDLCHGLPAASLRWQSAAKPLFKDHIFFTPTVQTAYNMCYHSNFTTYVCIMRPSLLRFGAFFFFALQAAFTLLF